MYTVALIRRGEGGEVHLYSIQVKTAIFFLEDRLNMLSSKIIFLYLVYLITAGSAVFFRILSFNYANLRIVNQIFRLHRSDKYPYS